LSPGSGRPGATGYPGYTSATAREATAAAMRYVQQSPYGGAVPYRENPYTVPRNPVRHMITQKFLLCVCVCVCVNYLEFVSLWSACG